MKREEETGARRREASFARTSLVLLISGVKISPCLNLSYSTISRAMAPPSDAGEEGGTRDAGQDQEERERIKTENVKEGKGRAEEKMEEGNEAAGTDLMIQG